MFFRVGKHFISISLFFFVRVLCPTLNSSRNIYRKECDQIFLQGNENSFNLPGCDVSICGAYLSCSWHSTGMRDMESPFSGDPKLTTESKTRAKSLVCFKEEWKTRVKQVVHLKIGRFHSRI